MAFLKGPDENEGEPGLLNEINTTPLIDVMLVLLIMLIVTIPVQTHAVKLDMPQSRMDAAPPPVVIALDVTADGTILWDGQPIASRRSLDERFLALAGQADQPGIPQPEIPQPEIHVHAADDAPYGQVAAILSSAQRQGIARIGIVE